MYDVCIVGTGFAGTFLCKQLLKGGFNTLMVEAGRTLTPYESKQGRADLLPIIQTGSSAFPVNFNRTIGVGGTSHKWNGVVDRFIPTDFHSFQSFNLFADWPISHDDIAAYYDEAEKALKTQYGTFSSGMPTDELKHLSLKPLNFSNVNSSGMPVRLDQEILSMLAGDENFTLMSDHTALRLIMDQQSEITGLEVGRPDGSTQLVYARQFVIAAGVVETTRLLLHSATDHAPNGIGNQHDQVGRYINVHPRPRIRVPRPTAYAHTKGVYRSYRYCDEFRREGLAAVCIDFNFIEPEPAIDLTIETEPTATNRMVRDNHQVDRWNRPLLRVHYEATPRDLQTRTRADQLHRQLVSLMLEPGSTATTEEEKTFHLSGGCRMAHQATEGVVDPNGLVFGTKNLSVAGAATFPTSGALNPTLTIVALALRLAEHLKGT